MSLDSSEFQAKVLKGGNIGTGLDSDSNPEVYSLSPLRKEGVPWSYLFIHHAKVAWVNEKLSMYYPTFIHKSIVYKRKNKHVRKEERPTISGLIFVQGESSKIQSFLSENFYGLYLVKDCITGKTAVIADSVMRPFMQVSQIEPTRIRFMPHVLEHYAVGHTWVRITSGALAGLEGFLIRISRDKCLVTAFGAMTVAISGVHKDSFENLDDYVRLRRCQMQEEQNQPDMALTPVQAEIHSCFFNPQNQLDVMAITGNLSPWMMKIREALSEKKWGDVVEMTLSILNELGSRFRPLYAVSSGIDCSSVDQLCMELGGILDRVLKNEEAPVDLKEIVETEKASLVIRYPFLPFADEYEF